MSQDVVERLIQAANRLARYLVIRSEDDHRIRDDEQLHALVENLRSAVVAAEDVRRQ